MSDTENIQETTAITSGRAPTTLDRAQTTPRRSTRLSKVINTSLNLNASITPAKRISRKKNKRNKTVNFKLESEKSIDQKLLHPGVFRADEEVIDLISPDVITAKDNTTEDCFITAINDTENLLQDSTKAEEKGDGDTFEISKPDETVVENEASIAKAVDVEEIISAPTSHRKSLPNGPRFSSTPARKSVATRKSTPFRPPKENSIKKALSSVAGGTPTPKKMALTVLLSPNVTPVSVERLVNKTPLKSVLRRSRRSYSVDCVDLNTTTKNRVMFHSPANTTISIEQIDFLMESKKKPNSVGEKTKDNVTMRRKRSLSVAETENEKEFIKSLQIDEINHIPKKAGKRPTPSSRTKIPNFAAIHQQNFDKMESIADHLNRRADRAKVLSSSKKRSALNNSVTQATNNTSSIKMKDLKRLNTSQTGAAAPKARQKIQLSKIIVEKKATASSTNTSIIKVEKKPTVSGTTPLSVENKTTTVVDQRKPKKEAKKIVEKKVASKARPALTTASPKIASEKLSEKLADRQKRHMAMYKNGRVNTTITQDAKTEFIHGVRSNRRFVLQMQHRDRLK